MPQGSSPSDRYRGRRTAPPRLATIATIAARGVSHRRRNHGPTSPIRGSAPLPKPPAAARDPWLQPVFASPRAVRLTRILAPGVPGAWPR